MSKREWWSSEFDKWFAGEFGKVTDSGTAMLYENIRGIFEHLLSQAHFKERERGKLDLRTLCYCLEIVKQTPHNSDNKLEIMDKITRAYKATTGNDLPIGELSDGYHTFNELYDHRIVLLALLCNMLAFNSENRSWKSKKHSDGSVWDGWFIAGIGTEKGSQITYHIPINRWKDFRVGVLKKAPEWDGHTPKDVLKRLKAQLKTKKKE